VLRHACGKRRAPIAHAPVSKCATSRSTSGRLEIACWGLSVALIASYFGARAYGEIERRHAIEAFADTRSLVVAESASLRESERVAREPIPERPKPDQTYWSRSRIRAYAALLVDVESQGLPVALLRIRRVGLEVPVYADAGERNLNRGAGLVAGTAPPGSAGNVAIAAHRDGYFRVLERVSVGDLLELESPPSRIRQYRVTELSVVEPTDIRPLHDTAIPTVTLVTCYPFYFLGSAPQRYIVRAVSVQWQRTIPQATAQRKGLF
jgi:sortase A